MMTFPALIYSPVNLSHLKRGALKQPVARVSSKPGETR